MEDDELPPLDEPPALALLLPPAPELPLPEPVAPLPEPVAPPDDPLVEPVAPAPDAPPAVFDAPEDDDIDDDNVPVTSTR